MEKQESGLVYFPSPGSHLKYDWLLRPWGELGVRWQVPWSGALLLSGGCGASFQNYPRLSATERQLNTSLLLSQN